MRNLLTLFDLSSDDLEQIFLLSHRLKAESAAGKRHPHLPGRVLALLFEKPSLRTRVSFETAIMHLGGNSLFLGKDVGWGERENVADFSQVLSEYVDAIVCRSTCHARVQQLAEHCRVPVINGLTDQAHPCQALADMFTLREIFPRLQDIKLAFIGDANNVARSLAIGAAYLDVEFAVASPENYGFDGSFVSELKEKQPGLRLLETTDPVTAVQDADAVYTDVWASMGQEQERVERAGAFAAYQVNAELMSHAKAEARFLHCLPARRGEEVTDEVIDGEQSAVIQQAGNRMHLQKGLLAWLLAGGRDT